MNKSTNILEFIGILQFSQTQLIFEINIAKEIEKKLERNFNETIMCLFSAFLWVYKGLKFPTSTFVTAIMFLQSMYWYNHPFYLCNRPGTRPLILLKYK